MSALRWIWLSLASLLVIAGTYVCDGGLGPDPHGWIGIWLGGPLFGIGAILLGILLLKIADGRTACRVAGWVILVLGLLPWSMLALIFVFRFL